MAAVTEGAGGRAFRHPDPPAVGQCHQTSGSVPGGGEGAQLAHFDAGLAQCDSEGGWPDVYLSRWRRETVAGPPGGFAGPVAGIPARGGRRPGACPAAGERNAGADTRGYPRGARYHRPVPHGAQAYNLQHPAELVDLSINFARLELARGVDAGNQFPVFNEAQSLPLQQQVLSLARVFGLAATSAVSCPGWEPDFDSPLLERACAHERLFGQRPAVKAIHAGLECGILKGKKPDMDILSFGPTIRGAHPPTERLQIDTVAPFWQFLTALLVQL